MADNVDSINIAFASDPKLRKRIFDAINETPQHAPLFEDIATYHLSGQQFSIVNGKDSETPGQPLKKRKIDDGVAVTNDAWKDQPRKVIFEARDTSFTSPQRKKLHLAIVQYGDNTNASTTVFTLCVSNPATGQIEFEYPVTDFTYVLRVPVPEKAQKQYNFCLIPKLQPGAALEPIIWTINATPGQGDKNAPDTGTGLAGTLDTVLQHGGNKLVYPTESEFASALVESHRKNEKAYHVKAFRGSKDGFLFFLENGIFFGFKKPLAFIPFHEIESVSYTAVLQRTFNLIVVIQTANDTEPQEIEFSMLDQADFAGIDAYIKKHQLQDASMAEARRAKQFKVNGPKDGSAEGHDDGGQTELQKAEQELDDEEDEMEEDYDPGSDGESEGSGSSDDEDYEYTRTAPNKDLVKDELGSEAEDVELTEDEDADGDEDAEEDEAEDESQREESNNVPKPTTQPIASAAHQPQHGAPDLDDDDQL